MSIVNSAPARLKHTRVQNAASLRGAWVVQLHRIMALDPESKAATVSVRAAVPSSMKDVKDCGLAMYLSNLSSGEMLELRVWAVQRGLVHSFDVQLMTCIPKKLHSSVAEILQLMINMPEWISLTGETTSDFEEALGILVGESLVEGPPCKLTVLGPQRVEQCVCGSRMRSGCLSGVRVT